MPFMRREGCSRKEKAMNTSFSDRPQSRRQLLTYAGALTGAALLSACTAPLLVVQPETTAPNGQGETQMTQPSANQEHATVTVVLVHGAFADGSGWQKVIPLLEKAGYNVT